MMTQEKEIIVDPTDAAATANSYGHGAPQTK
jgi:hypothetical protein